MLRFKGIRSHPKADRFEFHNHETYTANSRNSKIVQTVRLKPLNRKSSFEWFKSFETTQNVKPPNYSIENVRTTRSKQLNWNSPINTVDYLSGGVQQGSYFGNRKFVLQTPSIQPSKAQRTVGSNSCLLNKHDPTACWAPATPRCLMCETDSCEIPAKLLWNFCETCSCETDSCEGALELK